MTNCPSPGGAGGQAAVSPEDSIVPAELQRYGTVLKHAVVLDAELCPVAKLLT